MKKALLAVFSLIALALFTVPASAAQFDGMKMDASQSYMRLGFNDTIVLTVHVTDQGAQTGIANVPIALNFKTGGDYVVFGNQLVVTDSTGAGTATIMLNQENLPNEYRLPMQVMVEAVYTGNDAIRTNIIVYITSTGSIAGYVVDDSTSTITGATITVITPDGTTFSGGPFKSSNGSGSPMGYYRIDNLPVGLSGRNVLTAEKDGYSGSIKAEAGSDYNIRQDIVIHGYKDTQDQASIVTGNANITPTPVPATTNDTETPAKPTTMTTTIIIAIVLIALVYLGLKAYRRMF